MKRKKKILIIIGLAVIVAASSFWLWQTYYSEGEELIKATGTIEGTSVDINAKIAGTIEVLNIKSGDFVKKGDLIAELSRNDLVAQRERDELSVAKAEANLADLQSGAREQEMREAEAGINIIRTKLKQAEDELKRKEVLFKEKAITEVEYENAQNQVEILKNELVAAQARYDLLKAGSKPEVINAAQVEVARTKAVLKATDAMLADLKLYAPMDGIVRSKNFEVGEYVTAGDAIATIVNMDDLWIKVYIPTVDLPKIAVGDKVTFTVSGLSKKFTGVVEEIATKGEYTPKTIQTEKERANVVFAVKIGISSEGGILKPGMPADVIFTGGGRDD